MLASRFTIKRLMIAVAVIGLALGLPQHCTYSTLIILYILGLAFIAWFPNRGRSRAVSWAFFLTAAWLNLSLPTFYAFHPALHDEMLLFQGSLIFVPIVPGSPGWRVRSRPVGCTRPSTPSMSHVSEPLVTPCSGHVVAP
jgi:hypothetical protein